MGAPDIIARLKDKHRQAARLRAQGFTYPQISAQCGYLPNYWSRLCRKSPRFIAYLDACRAALEGEFVSSTARILETMDASAVEQLLARRARHSKRTGTAAH